MSKIRYRQVHLDFHTSEYIPDIAADFDKDEFAKTLEEAHVDSITCFARCHHGWLYYPSKKFPELIHPGLKNKNFYWSRSRRVIREGSKCRFIQLHSGMEELCGNIRVAFCG